MEAFMSVRHFRMTFLSLVLFFCSTACFAQTSCEPGHKFTPLDHERIVAAIANNAADVLKNVDFREINRANRANRVLEGALKAEGISPSDKQCIREVLKAPPVSVEALQKEEPFLSNALTRIRAATNLDELEAIVRSEAETATRNGRPGMKFWSPDRNRSTNPDSTKMRRDASAVPTLRRSPAEWRSRWRNGTLLARL